MQKKIKSTTDHLLKVSLHGMDEKMTKMMISYFKFTCKGIAVVVDKNEAQAEIVDVDNHHQFENILRQRLSQRPQKPIIALSLYTVSSKKVTFVKKPLDVPAMTTALKLVKDILGASSVINESGETNPEITTKSSLNNPGLVKIKTEKLEWDNEDLIEEENKQTNNPINLTQTLVAKTQKNTEKTDHKEINTITPDAFKRGNNKELDSTKKEKRFQHDRNNGRLLPKKNKINNTKKNLRKTIRYTFQAISCQLKSKSLFGFKDSLSVKILNISSNSALIQSKKPLKLRGKATINVKFDILNSFSIPVRVSRNNNNNNTYGLVFLKYQHELCDYLVNSGRPFDID